MNATPEIRKTMLLVGSGAVVDAWAPVISALRSLDYQVDCSESANFLLATETYWARMQVAYAPLRPSLDVEATKKEAFSRIERISNAIGTHLIEQPRTLRPEFQTMVASCLTMHPEEVVAITTTNWDTALQHLTDRGIPVFHLHGKAGGPLYLPSEISVESYRPQEHTSRMAANHRAFHKAMTDCEHLILYGVSLSPLDAELGLLIQTRAETLKKVTIVNPDHTTVLARLKVLRGKASFPIFRLQVNEGPIRVG